MSLRLLSPSHRAMTEHEMEAILTSSSATTPQHRTATAVELFDVERGAPRAQPAPVVTTKGSFISTLRKKLSVSTALLAICLGWVMACDRFQLFQASDKQPLIGRAAIVCVVVLAAGLSTMRQSKDEGLLGLNQTTEWKGWLQAVLLLYHYFGSRAQASTIIFAIIRIDVASFVFMTGFGHGTFAMKKGLGVDMQRVVSLVVRINFLCWLFAMVSGKTWVDYYFCPLITFFTLYIYFVNALIIHLPPWWRVAIAFGLSTALFDFGLFSLITKLLVPEGYQAIATKMQGRLFLDHFAAPLGMAVAAAMPQLKVAFEQIGTSPRKIAGVAVLCLLSMIMWGFYVLNMDAGVDPCLADINSDADAKQQQYVCNNFPKKQYESVNAYTFFVPLVAFMVLRNLTPSLRSYHSAFFMYLGRISLELYLGQYHIWMTKFVSKILVLLPGADINNNSIHWWLNFVLSTSLFVFVCDILNSSCGVIIGFLLSDKFMRWPFKLLAVVIIFVTLASGCDRFGGPDAVVGSPIVAALCVPLGRSLVATAT